MTGRIHSFQSFGGADGPGMRYVVFLQGCPLRCVYCHNPDTWEINAGEQYAVEEIVRRAVRFRPYFGGSGGVTLSGGEPLMQPRFAAALFAELHAANIRTALDTSGAVNGALAEAVLLNTDLVICDIKFPFEEQYLRYTGGSLKAVCEFLKQTESLDIPLWVRHVVVPGLTDSEDGVRRIAALAKGFRNLQKIELLPFKKICAPKYKALKIPFPLADTPECTAKTLETLSVICRLP